MSLLCSAMGMFPVLDHADINNMNVSVTMVNGQNKSVFSALPSSVLNSRRDVTVPWFS